MFQFLADTDKSDTDMSVMFPILPFFRLRVKTFCINLESIALVEVLAFTLVNI